MDSKRSASSPVISYVFLSLVLFAHSTSSVHHRNAHIKDKITTTELLAENDEGTLLISTLDGALHAIAKSSGLVKWKLTDGPVINNPTDSSQPPVPQFFPNPQDGSLYRYNLGRGRDPLKKLPFTIPQLVANSPCRSSDGIFYLGKKVDSWIGVDAITGEKQLVLGVEGVDRKCPKPSRNTVYFGRTLYNIILYEAATGNKWNISFSEYATSAASSTIENYDLVHYTSTGEGSILTVDQRTGSLLWTLELDSPLVAMYHLGPEGGLFTVPMTTVAPQTLTHFTEEFMQIAHKPPGTSDGLLIKKLSPTIYIGECNSGVYALPSLVDAHTATISRRGSQLLLEGPPGTRGTLGPRQQKEPTDNTENTDVLLLGYYEIPENVKADLSKASPDDLAEIRDNVLMRPAITHETNNNNNNHTHTRTNPDNQPPSPHTMVLDGFAQMRGMNVSFVTSGQVVVWAAAVARVAGGWLLLNSSNILIVTLSLGFVAILYILYKQAQDYARLSQEVSSRRQWSRGSSGSGAGGNVTAVAEERHDGTIIVGKIIFDPQLLLGKGCDGTFVFRGTFDGRSVAVKRVLPECFSIADREVDLLRESDQHPNVIRYFCTEQCRQFRYIALELCSATLEDHIQGKFKADISTLSILHQATSGLLHLHNLDIVHRDVKPHNVLLSLPTAKGHVRAMISDFGLCKRLETGRMSFSKRSGVTGTEGWIAPEMMLNTSRPTCKVDIFSLGCVYYYMLTKGKHPFGSVLDRQSNIISGKFNLEDLHEDEDINCTSLIEKMLSSKPSERPPTSAILKHPFYWNPERVMGFFQDVSDRVEKESVESGVVMSLERVCGGGDVVRGDWRQHMHPAIAEDLRRFRDYKGRSVRDLLRALRNKKNHYRELSEEARMVFGRIPDEYVRYWTERFPRLLLHTWYAMQCVKSEPIFGKYYDEVYNFGQTFIYETHAMAPNNPLAQDSIRQSFLDTLLQRGMVKNAGNQEEVKNPVWVIRKPQNTFEPKYKPSEVRNIEGPWRRPTDDEVDERTEEAESPKRSSEEKASLHHIADKVKNVSRLSVEALGSPKRKPSKERASSRRRSPTNPWKIVENNSPINQGQKPENIEECRLQPNSQGEESQMLQNVASSSDSDKERLEGGGILSGSQGQSIDDGVSIVSDRLDNKTDQADPHRNITEVPEMQRDVEQTEMRRDASQLRFRPIGGSPEKPPSEPEKQIKIVTGSGKKKKTKNLVMGNKPK